ncbi:MAG: ATP-binding protein [Gammaproteobacteria bacterium]
MKLRSQIILFLSLFAILPLSAVVMMNFPLVFSQLERFYQEAHLQNLRADFRDLDQHLASRHDTVRLLAKLPESPLLLGRSMGGMPESMTMMREGFTHWVNRMLSDQPDIVQVLFIDPDLKIQVQLERDPQSWKFVNREERDFEPAEAFVQQGLQGAPGTVFTSPLRIAESLETAKPERLMSIRVISPVIVQAPPSGELQTIGAAILTIDVGGLARAHAQNLWVLSNGNYLPLPGARPEPGAAFQDFPGLEEVFADRELSLWRGPDDERILWVPMLPLEDGTPLWVGRKVDRSPIDAFGDALRMRVLYIVLGLAALVWLTARWFAQRAERFREQITDGLSRVLQDEPVEFELGGSQEMVELGKRLTTLARKHNVRSQALREHARELEESNRYKSQFLANVSHELRTPLNSILLLSKLLSQDDERTLSEQQRQQARVIHEAGSDLKSLIDNILDLSRIEAGRNVVHVEPVDLEKILGGIIELLQPQFQQKGLALELQIDPSAPAMIETDGDKLRQIVKNFLSNAVKFTSEGGVTLRIACTRGERAERLPLSISVQDTGIGIPEDKHAVIFEAFQQADGSTNRRFGGTGLGLSISRELARLMGGRIHLDSHEGRGSTFTLMLPLRTEHTEEEQEPEDGRNAAPEKAVEAPVPEASFPGKRVLAVDDDLRNLLALTPTLENWGIEVTGAGDGDEALEAMSEEDFDLVLMDIMMPGMDGLEATRRIRAHQDWSTIPVIALSARAAAEDQAECMAAGATAFLAKPLEPGLLLTQLERLLNAGGNEKQ